MGLGNLLLIPGLGAQPSLLDSFGGAAAAYSVRRLRAGYSGSCIRIRRSTDNAEFDIGFTNGLVDTSLILSLVGAGSAFVTTVYDQTGNGNHLTQTTTLAQPMIVNTGTVLTKNGRPAIDFTASQWMQATISGLSNATNLSNFAVISPNAEAVGEGTVFHMMSYAGGGADTSTRGGTVGSVATGLLTGEKFGMFFSSATVSSGRLGSSSYHHLAGQQLITSAFFLSSGSLAFQNGSAISFNLSAVMNTGTPVAPANDDSATSTFRINSVDGISGTTAEMFQESIVYLSNYTANRTGVETNMSDFYYGTADVKAKVGVSSSPIAIGSQAITGVGFQPKAVLPFGGPSATAGVAINGAIIGLGAGVAASNRCSITISSDNGVTTSDADRRHDNTKVFTTLSSTGSVLEACDLSAIGSDGFTLDWATIDPSARLFNHICLGGADVEVSLTLCQMNNTNSAQSFAHGLSGPPTGLILFSTHDATVPPNTAATSAMTLGLWSSAAGYASSVWASSGVTTTATRRMLTNQAVMQFNTTATHTIIRSLAISSVDASNVNVTYPITTSTGQSHFYMLAVRGAKCQTGIFDCNGLLGPLGISCMGITPKLFLGLAVPECVDNINTVRDSINFSLWASDGTNHVSCGITDLNGMTTSNTRRHQYSTVLSEITASDGSQQFQGTAKFVGQSVVITPTLVASSSFGQGAYLIIGA